MKMNQKKKEGLIPELCKFEAFVLDQYKIAAFNQLNFAKNCKRKPQFVNDILHGRRQPSITLMLADLEMAGHSITDLLASYLNSKPEVESVKVLDLAKRDEKAMALQLVADHLGISNAALIYGRNQMRGIPRARRITAGILARLRYSKDEICQYLNRSQSQYYRLMSQVTPVEKTIILKLLNKIRL